MSRAWRRPLYSTTSNFNFGDQAQRARLTPLMASINQAGAAERDAAPFIAWLDMQRSADRTKKIGAQGYCMCRGAMVDVRRTRWAKLGLERAAISR